MCWWWVARIFVQPVQLILSARRNKLNDAFTETASLLYSFVSNFLLLFSKKREWPWRNQHNYVTLIRHLIPRATTSFKTSLKEINYFDGSSDLPLEWPATFLEKKRKKSCPRQPQSRPTCLSTQRITTVVYKIYWRIPFVCLFWTSQLKQRMW